MHSLRLARASIARRCHPKQFSLHCELRCNENRTMQPAAFDYFAPPTLAEAAALLASGDGDARIIAGGQSLVAAMNLRLARPRALIDLRRVPDLDRIEIGATSVRIGARVTHAQIIASASLRAVLPVLAQAGGHISHTTIRERGTMAGSLALADPAAEWPSVLLALGGSVRVMSTRGERTISADAFFVSYYTTALALDEIITAVELPLPMPGERCGFAEFSRQTGAFALALAVAKLEFDARGS